MKALLLAMLLAQGADLTTTAYGMTHGCYEGNPTLRTASINHIATVKGSAVAVEATIAWGAHRKGYTKAGKAVLWTGIAMGTFAAVWNGRQITKCGR